MHLVLGGLLVYLAMQNIGISHMEQSHLAAQQHRGAPE